MSHDYTAMSHAELCDCKAELQASYDQFQALGLKLNMARGKPSSEQLDLSMEMLDILHSSSDVMTGGGDDCRNYGMVDGLPEMRNLFSEMLGVDAENIIIGGNSSLNMMFDITACAMERGFSGYEPWNKQGTIKFLCPVPGYDRHFGINEYFGIEMIKVPMTSTGPDMDVVEELVSSDPQIKGIWCVPKYSNPQGITYSDETVRRFAALKPAARDFHIFWDNAYCVHELTDSPDQLLNLFEECKKNGNEDLPLLFCSTSKITFAGAGVAALAGSRNTLANYRMRLSMQTIGPNKVNQLSHVRFLKNLDGIKAHMEKHRQLLAPRFRVVLDYLENELGGKGVAAWMEPKGGYFVSVDVMEGCAKRVVSLCQKAGVVLTGAGATYPYGEDPKDSNIRLAPSYPPVNELEQAMKLFCISAKLAVVEKLLAEK